MSEMFQLHQVIVIGGNPQTKLDAIADALKFGPEHIQTELTDIIREQQHQTDMLHMRSLVPIKFKEMSLVVKTAKAASWFRMKYHE